ncbi:hypothetical protein HF324_20480 [Chitinophaga oryzae]|uniref:Uncharacterized protein n=1 Tax=Chitinophaga oryzae TaxID=2725414 RepID=A0AAE6ZIE0_9BACT|nr:hypothetical protein [Chitinophaga oryzae]QJB33581.1 hypothetical protein HF329_20600 [Chitinophaga oryzae]QJB40103.1 hypothetical protein HF324_20480 [Chitinophaga oryzae]
MKTKIHISKTFSLSCLLAGAMALFAISAVANTLLPTDNEKEKAKKTDNVHFVLNTAMPKTNLALDAGYRFTGSYNSNFKFTNTNVINFQSVMTYTKGNMTYVVPYTVQPIQQPSNMNFQKLQIILPLKKG